MVLAVEPSMSVNRIARKAVCAKGSPASGFEDRAHERSHRARVDEDDPGGRQSMRVTVNGLHRNGIRALRQAESRPAVGIEPVGDVADAVLLFDLHIASVCNR